MRMRKPLSLLLAVAMMLATFLIFAVPAWAASINISGVEEVKTNGPRNLTATATGGVGELSSLSLKAGGTDLGTTNCSIQSTSCSRSATWDPPSSNGAYDVVATATRRLGGGDISKAVQVKVNIPPVRPANVKVALDGSVPTVTWKANPESDLKGYRVTRSAGGSSKSFSLGKVTRFTDSDAPVGVELAYQVFAVRNSPVSASGVESPASASAKILIPRPDPDPAPEGGSAQATADPAQASADPVQSGKPEGSAPESAPGPSNPVVLAPADPKPIDAPNLPPQVTVGPRRDVGYAPLLPYTAQLPSSGSSGGEEAAPEPVEAEEAEGGEGLVTPIALPNNLQRPAMQKSLYVAGALLLVVTALHITRAARRLGDVAEIE